MILSLMGQLNPNVTFKRVTLRSNVEVYSIVTHVFGVNYPPVILIVAEQKTV